LQIKLKTKKLSKVQELFHCVSKTRTILHHEIVAIFQIIENMLRER
jgi:hypothetical protein